MKEFVVLVSQRAAGSEFQTRCRSGNSMLAVMLKPVSGDGESDYITCRMQSARDSVRTGKVREI